MGLFDNPFKKIEKQIKRSFDDLLDLPRKLEEETRRVDEQIVGALFGGGGGDQITTPQTTVESPFKLGGQVIDAGDDLRRRLAAKKGVKSTNITGGIRGDSPVFRPTLFLL